MRRRIATILALAASLAQGAEGGGMLRTFTLQRPLDANGSAVLEMHVGPLAPGQRVRVTTPTGELIGTISPFGAAARGRAGVYSLPVPRDAFRDGTLSTRVTIIEGDKPPRPPTASEVQSLKLLEPNAPR